MVYFSAMVPRLLTLLLILTCIFRQGDCQDYVFNRLSINDGLLSNNVRSVWQDETGYLWVGTESGLQRYDGSRFRTILNERVEQIISDAGKRVWIRSGKRVGIFNPRTFTFTPISYEGSDEIYSYNKIWLRKDASGNVFVQLTGKNCQYFDSAVAKFSASNNPFKAPNHLKILDVAEDVSKQRYWLLSSEGLAYWDKKAKTYYSVSNNVLHDPLLEAMKNASIISDFFIDGSNNYWLQEDGNAVLHFYSYNSRTNQFTADAESLNKHEDNSYFDIYGFENIDDSTTAVYGLNYFRISNGRDFQSLKYPINNPYGIHFNSVSDVMEDKEETIWVATDNGLYYSSAAIENIHVVFDAEKNRSAISSLVEDHNKNLWVATWGRGAFVLDSSNVNPVATHLMQINKLDDFAKMMWTLCEDGRGNMWIGCNEGRLISYNLQSKKARLYHPSSFGKSAVRQIAKDRTGLLWLGLQDGRVFTFNPAQTVSDKALQEVCSLQGAVTRMLVVNDHYVWIAVNGKGIYAIDTDSKQVVQAMDIQTIRIGAITSIKDILQVNDTLYFVSGEKLGAINVKTYTVNFELPYNTSPVGTIYTLQKERDDQFWLAGSNGIFKLNATTKTLTKYSQQDGLITVHNNSYVPERSARLRSGLLAFGGNQHLVVFDPAHYSASTQPPDVTITGFQLNDKYLPQDSLDRLKEIAISYDQRDFAVEFAALGFSQRGKLFYEYKLDGMDKEWITQSELAAVKYNYLPHGKYTFFVRARNAMGQYSAATTLLDIYIVPPFWKTIWFYCLIALATASLLFYLHRLRLQKLLHIEKVRSRLARDLHDDMGSTLSTINILSNMALQQKTVDETKNKEYMRTINSNTSQMMEAMDDIVWSINPANDSIAKIIARMKETAGVVLEPRQIEYRFDVHPSVPELRLDMEVRREIFLVFKEALNNIIKYADCSEVVFTLEKNGSKFLLVIKDNGKGFRFRTSTSTVRGNGLKNMEKRAATIKGQFSVDSEPGKGTAIQLIVPIA